MTKPDYRYYEVNYGPGIGLVYKAQEHLDFRDLPIITVVWNIRVKNRTERLRYYANYGFPDPTKYKKHFKSRIYKSERGPIWSPK